MSEDEDYNEFTTLDCAGASGMLALVPAVFYYVSHDHDKIGTLMMASVAVGVAVVVWILAYLLGHRVVGRLLQVVGIVLCVLFWLYAIHMWSHSDKLSGGAAAPEAQQTP